MPSIKIREDELLDMGLKRFRRACDKEGILGECRRRAFYQKPNEVRRRKMEAARKRFLKKLKRDRQNSFRGAPSRG